MRIVEIPKTEFERLTVCDKCGNQLKSEMKNKFKSNLIGLLNLESKQWTLAKIYDFAKTYGKIMNAENTLELEESEYQSLFDMVKDFKGWGDFSGQLEFYQAFIDAQKVN